MIRQVAYLPHYDWTIKAYFAVTGYWVNEIMAELAYAGANEEEMRLSYISLIPASWLWPRPRVRLSSTTRPHMSSAIWPDRLLRL